jgi:ABC-type phosphate transport system substrate-binding protein
MSNRRSAALALATCAASLSVAACSAGITSAPPATSTAAPTHSASVAATTSASPATSSRMIAISGSIGSFPVPARAKVAENVGEGQTIIVMFNSVTPADVSSFYATVLPRLGYAISGNSLINEGGGTEAIIEFSGHGYKGNIATLSHFSGGGVSVAGLGTRNVSTIELTAT